MNTGIQDAHNLAWKIASVLEGITPVSFLSTYEMERKPVSHVPYIDSVFINSNAVLLIFTVFFFLEFSRLPVLIQHLAYRTSKQLWQFLPHLGLIPRLQMQVNYQT